MLALSRALGDFEYKNNSMMKPQDQAVTAHPDIMCVQLSSDVEYILLACDGLWDCKTSNEAVQWLNEKVYKNGKPSMDDLRKGVEAIIDECCATDIGASQGLGCDNITACIVDLKH